MLRGELKRQVYRHFAQEGNLHDEELGRSSMGRNGTIPTSEPTEEDGNAGG